MAMMPVAVQSRKGEVAEQFKELKHNNIITGKSPDPSNAALLDAYQQDLIKQGDRFDELTKELLKLELAIPGIYAVVLRLLMGQSVPVSTMLVSIAFLLWLVALALTLLRLFPFRWSFPGRPADGIRPGPESVRTYFHEVARNKRRYLLPAIPCFFAGIMAAIESGARAVSEICPPLCGDGTTGVFPIFVNVSRNKPFIWSFSAVTADFKMMA